MARGEATVKVNVESSIADRLKKFFDNIQKEYGISVENVDVEWFETIGSREVLKIEISTAKIF